MNPLRAGESVFLKGEGGYIGGTQAKGAELKAAGNPLSNEIFVVENNGDLYALRQTDSGLYLGGSSNDGDRPKLQQDREPFKVDVRNGRVSFYSRSNARLCTEGNTLVWRNNPNNKDLF